jgi:hypothetical protein
MVPRERNRLLVSRDQYVAESCPDFFNFSFLIMNLNSTHKKNTVSTLFCILLSIFTTVPALCQSGGEFAFDSVLPRHNIGVTVQTALLPGGKIQTTTGNYYLQSKPQLSFSAAFIYKVNLGYKWSIDYGAEFNVISTNYYLHIPDADLPGYPGTKGAPQIQDKQAYFKTALSALLSYNSLFSQKGFWSVSFGAKLNYSGFSIDERIGAFIADTNRQLSKIFTGEFTSNNNKKPWISYEGGFSKTRKLKNEGLFSIGLFAELSTTDFIKGNYQITIPNRPVAEGRYSVNGSGIGLSFQYLFPRRKHSH